MADRRFEKVYSDSGGFTGPYTMILVDKETGVNYLYVGNGHGGGLTPLLKSDGTPVVTPVNRYDE